MKQKKGNIPITILVFLVLALLLSSLLVGYLLKKEGDQNYNFSLIQETIYDKNTFEENLYFISKNALIETFKEFSKGENYDYMRGRRNTGEFSEIHPNLNENFNDRFKENFLEILSTHKPMNPEMNTVYNNLKNGGFQNNFSNGTLTLIAPYISIKQEIEGSNPSQKIIYISYKTNITIKISLNGTDLEDFKKIYEAKEKCKREKSEEEMENCFNLELKNFYTNVRPVTDFQEDSSRREYPFESFPSDPELKKIVYLKTKEYFAIEGELKQIEIKFIPK